MSRNDGGPAFPRRTFQNPNIGKTEWGQEGMTLRQWYKGMERSEPEWTVEELAQLLGISMKEWDNIVHWPIAVAKWRGMIADALIAEDAAIAKAEEASHAR